MVSDNSLLENSFGTIKSPKIWSVSVSFGTVWPCGGLWGTGCGVGGRGVFTGLGSVGFYNWIMGKWLNYEVCENMRYCDIAKNEVVWMNEWINERMNQFLNESVTWL